MQVHRSDQVTKKLEVTLDDKYSILPKKFLNQASEFLDSIDPFKISIIGAKDSGHRMVLNFLIRNKYAEGNRRCYTIPIKYGSCFAQNLWEVLCFPLDNVRVASRAYSFMNEEIDNIYRASKGMKK